MFDCEWGDVAVVFWMLVSVQKFMLMWYDMNFGCSWSGWDCLVPVGVREARRVALGEVFRTPLIDSQRCLCSYGGVIICHMRLGKRIIIVTNVSICVYMCMGVSGGVIVNGFKKGIVMLHFVVRFLVIAHDVV